MEFRQIQGICAIGSTGRRSSACRQCLVGPQWDSLRQTLGTELVRGKRGEPVTIAMPNWTSGTLLASLFRILAEVRGLHGFLGASVPHLVAGSGAFVERVLRRDVRVRGMPRLPPAGSAGAKHSASSKLHLLDLTERNLRCGLQETLGYDVRTVAYGGGFDPAASEAAEDTCKV